MRDRNLTSSTGGLVDIDGVVISDVTKQADQLQAAGASIGSIGCRWPPSSRPPSDL